MPTRCVNPEYGISGGINRFVSHSKAIEWHNLLLNLIIVPNKYKYTHYVAIDVSGLDVIKGRDGVFVVRGNTDLDISDRIVSSGKIKCGG